MAQGEWRVVADEMADMRHMATMLPRDRRGRVCIDPGALDNIFRTAITMADALDRKEKD